VRRLPDPSRSRAVLIGVADYSAKSPLAPIPAIRNNVRDLRRLLTLGRPAPFSPERTIVVTDPASRRDIGMPLLEAARQAEDVFLVYYAGHGLLGEESRELYLALVGSDHETPSITAFSFAGIREAFRASPARNRVLILDCCFSGRAITGGLSANGTEILSGTGENETVESVADRMEIAGTYTLTSAPPNGIARYVDDERHTAFTGQLLLALRDGIPGAPGDDVTLGDLYQHLKRTLPARGLPQPQRCGTDTAELLVLSRPSGRSSPKRPRRPGRSGGPGEELIRRRDSGHRTGEAGHTAAAAREFSSVIPELTQAFGRDDRETLIGRIGLAYWTGLAGDPQEALTLSADAVTDLTRVLGPDDRATLVGRAQLAYWTGETGAPRDALRLTSTLVTDLKRILGAEDRETLVNRARLTRWTGESGDADGAARSAAAWEWGRRRGGR
jgi:caspase domain-containing protein